LSRHSFATTEAVPHLLIGISADRHAAGKWVRRAAGPYLFKPIVPAPRLLCDLCDFAVHFLPKGIDAHRATLQAIQNPKSNIQNPSSSASLGGLRALAVQTSSSSAMIPVGETPTPLEAPRASTAIRRESGSGEPTSLFFLLGSNEPVWKFYIA